MHIIEVGNVYRAGVSLKFLILNTDGYEVRVRNLVTGHESTRHVPHIHKAWTLIGKRYSEKS